MKIREQTCTIALRVPVSWRERYEAEASARGRTLSEHLRAKLDEAGGTNSAAPDLGELRQLIAEAIPTPASSIGSDVDRGLLLEAVLRLRRGATPQDSDRIYAEIERNKLKPWKGWDPRNAS